MTRVVFSAVAAVTIVGGIALLAAKADAQASCPRCARATSLETCIQCNMAAGPWNRKQSINWCRRMMAQCGGR